MKDDIDSRFDTPAEDIAGVGFFENSFAEISPDNDSNWNISFEGINNNIFKSNGNKSKALSYEIPREDAVKLAGIIDRILKGEYI